MPELGNVLDVSGGVRAAQPTRGGIESPTGPTPDRAIADDDAAEAVIRNPPSTNQTAPDTRGAGRNSSVNPSIEETFAAVKNKVAELRQIAEEIRNGRFSARQTGDKLEADAEDIKNSDDITARRVYSDVSELLARFKEEIRKIRSFDGFLLGVHDKIERFSPPAEFDLDQVQDVMQHMADVNSKLELGVFSLARVREKALKALRSQDEPEPERVLKLLEDDSQKPNAGQPPVTNTAPPEQQNT